MSCCLYKLLGCVPGGALLGGALLGGALTGGTLPGGASGCFTDDLVGHGPGGSGYCTKWGRLLRSRGLRYGPGNSLLIENVPGRTVHFITVPFVMLCHADGSKCARKDRPLCQSPLSRFVEEVFDGVVEVLFVLVDDVGGGADGFGEGFGVCAPVEGFVDGFFGVDLGR